MTYHFLFKRYIEVMKFIERTGVLVTRNVSHFHDFLRHCVSFTPTLALALLASIYGLFYRSAIFHLEVENQLLKDTAIKSLGKSHAVNLN